MKHIKVNENTAYKNVWNKTKSVLRGKFTALKRKSQIKRNLSFALRKKKRRAK